MQSHQPLCGENKIHVTIRNTINIVLIIIKNTSINFDYEELLLLFDSFIYFCAYSAAQRPIIT
jgi:hypothetical protein